MLVACVDNLSAYPFRVGDQLAGADIIFGSPSQCAEWFASGAFDAALLPVAALPELEDVQRLPFGIACAGPVSSVLLFSQQPIRQLLEERQPIYVTPHSQTSRALLHQLCLEEFGIAPRLTSHPASPARLLIGNDSADMQREEHLWPFVCDLGAWWQERTGHAFTFAQWVVRDTLTALQRVQLAGWLKTCATEASTDAGREAMADRAVSLGLLGGSKARGIEYYRRLRCVLGSDELKGLELFLAQERKDASCRRSA